MSTYAHIILLLHVTASSSTSLSGKQQHHINPCYRQRGLDTHRQAYWGCVQFSEHTGEYGLSGHGWHPLYSPGQSGHNRIQGLSTSVGGDVLQCHIQGFTVVDIRILRMCTVSSLRRWRGGYWQANAIHVNPVSARTLTYIVSLGIKCHRNRPNMFMFDLSHPYSTDVPNKTALIPVGSRGWLNLAKIPGAIGCILSRPLHISRSFSPRPEERTVIR